MDQILFWVLEMFKDHPQLQALFVIIGILRTVFKPTMSLIHTWVDATPSVKDNEIWDKIRKSKAMEVILYVLDWSASIKLPQPKK